MTMKSFLSIISIILCYVNLSQTHGTHQSFAESYSSSSASAHSSSYSKTFSYGSGVDKGKLPIIGPIPIANSAASATAYSSAGAVAASGASATTNTGHNYLNSNQNIGNSNQNSDTRIENNIGQESLNKAIQTEKTVTDSIPDKTNTQYDNSYNTGYQTNDGGYSLRNVASASNSQQGIPYLNFPGRNGSIYDYQIASQVKNSAGVSGHISSGSYFDNTKSKPCCKGPFPGPLGSIYDSKPAYIAGAHVNPEVSYQKTGVHAVNTYSDKPNFTNDIKPPTPVYTQTTVYEPALPQIPITAAAHTQTPSISRTSVSVPLYFDSSQNNPNPCNSGGECFKTPQNELQPPLFQGVSTIKTGTEKVPTEITKTYIPPENVQSVSNLPKTDNTQDGVVNSNVGVSYVGNKIDTSKLGPHQDSSYINSVSSSSASNSNSGTYYQSSSTIFDKNYENRDRIIYPGTSNIGVASGIYSPTKSEGTVQKENRVSTFPPIIRNTQSSTTIQDTTYNVPTTKSEDSSQGGVISNSGNFISNVGTYTGSTSKNTLHEGARGSPYAPVSQNSENTRDNQAGVYPINKPGSTLHEGNRGPPTTISSNNYPGTNVNTPQVQQSSITTEGGETQASFNGVISGVISGTNDQTIHSGQQGNIDVSNFKNYGGVTQKKVDASVIPNKFSSSVYVDFSKPSGQRITISKPETPKNGGFIWTNVGSSASSNNYGNSRGFSGTGSVGYSNHKNVPCYSGCNTHGVKNYVVHFKTAVPQYESNSYDGIQKQYSIGNTNIYSNKPGGYNQGVHYTYSDGGSYDGSDYKNRGSGNGGFLSSIFSNDESTGSNLGSYAHSGGYATSGSFSKANAYAKASSSSYAAASSGSYSSSHY